VIVFKWRIVLGGVASACFLGTFAAGPAFASTASPDRVPVAVSKPALPNAAQLIPGALTAVTTLPVVSAVTKPVAGVLSALGSGQASGPASTPNLPVSGQTGLLPAAGSATGALLNGVSNVLSNASSALLPALGPAVSGLTAPVDGITQVVGNLAGLPVVGPLIDSIPALPDTGALLGDLSGLVNGPKAGS
jgi:hypothetical protein